MSELQDKLDHGEITLDEYHASWIAQMAEMNDFIPAFTTGSMNIWWPGIPVPVLKRMLSLLWRNRTEYPPNSKQRAVLKFVGADELIASRKVRWLWVMDYSKVDADE
jgi:hypothetical protein